MGLNVKISDEEVIDIQAIMPNAKISTFTHQAVAEKVARLRWDKEQRQPDEGEEIDDKKQELE